MSDNDEFYGLVAAFSILGLISKFISPKGLILFLIVAWFFAIKNAFAPISTKLKPKPLVEHWEQPLLVALANEDYQRALAIDEAYLKKHPKSCEALQWRLNLYGYLHRSGGDYRKCSSY